MLTLTSKILTEVLEAASLASPGLPIPVNGVYHDSRLVQGGGLFVAIPCPQVEAYAREALGKGALALVGSPSLKQSLGAEGASVPFIETDNPRHALARLAAAYYPQQPETMVAVTGTNGKSSAVSMVHQLWSRLGHSSASMGTLGLDAGSRGGMMAAVKMPYLTTPDALSFHQALQIAQEQGITHMAFEASSHGLDQYRIHGVRLAAAALTNLTHDHLDYHGSLQAYCEAKVRLFAEVLPPEGAAVLNQDTAFFDTFFASIKARHQKLISYSLHQPAYLQASHIELGTQHATFTLWCDGRSYGRIQLAMAGQFQVENTLCAMGLLLATGTPLTSLLPHLEHLKSAPGRMECVGQVSSGGYIYVDYSHTPDSLQRALQSLRLHVSGAIWVVFGCGGDRDREKRFAMGEAVRLYADHAIVTDDNPRTENPEIIRAAALEGCPGALEIGDRAQAIYYGMDQLGPDDVLLVAGKGHEQGQIVKDRVLPFDDKTTILTYLRRKGGSHV